MVEYPTQEEIKRLFEYRDGRLFNKVNRCTSKKGERAGTQGRNGSSGYWYIKIKGKFYSEHRLIFKMFYNYLPEVIDHIEDKLTSEGIKSNKIENLREVTSGQNYQKARLKENNSKYRGVYFHKGETYQVVIAGVNRGTFKTKLEASIFYDREAIRLYGEHCFTNHPKKYYKKGGKYFDIVVVNTRVGKKTLGIKKNKSGTFQARVYNFGNPITIGTFKTVKEAVKAHDNKIREIGDSLIKINNPTKKEIKEIERLQNERN